MTDGATGVARRAADGFRAAFGGEPAGVWWAPGRVNLIGEHTDYNDGLVLPFALPWGAAAALRPHPDGWLRIRSAQRPDPVDLRMTELAPGAVDGWAGYVAGVVWALAEAGHRIAGADVLIDSDVPVGAGLSSSAALECSVALALDESAGFGLDRGELARLAQHAENDFVGAPTGGMDQHASLRCTAGHALFLDTRSQLTAQVPFDVVAAGMRVLIIDTGARHALVAGEYGSRREECERAARELGVPALRDVTDVGDALAALTDPMLRRRVRHVVTENNRVEATVGLLHAGAIAEIGALLNGSHLSLRDDFEISTPELDAAVDAAVRAGARGARLTGGGFGGCAIALVPADRIAQVTAAVTQRFASRKFVTPHIMQAVPSPGAHRVPTPWV